MRTRLQRFNVQAIKALRRVLYLPIRLYPTKLAIEVIYRIDGPLRDYIINSSGVLNFKKRIR